MKRLVPGIFLGTIIIGGFLGHYFGDVIGLSVIIAGAVSAWIWAFWPEIKEWLGRAKQDFFAIFS